MTSVLYILLAILALSLLIVLHELGHFLMGRLLGFGIYEFAVGMGPTLFRIRGKKCDFALRAFLIGGSCKFYGEDESAAGDEKQDADDEDAKPARIGQNTITEREFPPETRFNAQKPWKRLLVLAAGPLMNFLTALALAFILLLAYGSNTTIGTEQYLLVTEVEAGSAAEAAGIEAGDVLVALNGEAFETYDAFAERLAAVRENEAEITVVRGASTAAEQTVQGDTTVTETHLAGGETIVLRAEEIRDKHTGNNRLGVSMYIVAKSYSETKYNVLTAATGSFAFCGDIVRMVYESLFALFTGKACINEMSGAIGTVSIMSEAMETASSYGVSSVLYTLLYLCTLISANLAVINLLPIPALDGGRLVFVVIEMIRRKPIPPEKEGIVHFVGMVLLLGLFVVLMVSDVMNCFRG
ncbi:MAG: site-2 protease family protein [Clostridia bacterium]|nr:site-2 protease family protein [Clostridia bacterium]